MAAMTNTDAAAFLKERYTTKRVANLVYPRKAFFAMVPKKTDFGGEDLKVPIQYADTAGLSDTFADALANKNPSKTKAFKVTTGETYGLFSIKGKTMMQSRGDANAFFTALDRESKSAMNGVARRVHVKMYRSYDGVIGQIHATSGAVTGTTITLANRGQATCFEVGQKLCFAQTRTGALRDSGDVVTVAGVNRDLGTVTTSEDLDATVTGIAQGDYIKVDGDHLVSCYGLEDWIPSAAPSSGESFFNVDRSVDTRLYGHRVDASTDGLNPLQAIIKAITRIGESGGSPTHAFCSFDVWNKIVLLLGAQVEYVKGAAKMPDGKGGWKQSTEVSFRGVKVIGPDAEVEVYPDSACQYNTIWVLQLDTWTLHSTGECPMVLGLDNNTVLRETNDDAYEGRVGSYYQLYSDAPGWNAVIINV